MLKTTIWDLDNKGGGDTPGLGSFDENPKPELDADAWEAPTISRIVGRDPF